MRLFEGTEFYQPPKCDACGELEEACVCPPPAIEFKSPEKQTARLATEKRKKGKIVTVIRGLAAADNDLPDLLTRLKNACGAGGTIKDDTIEIQGKHQARVESLLREIGFKVKAS